MKMSSRHIARTVGCFLAAFSLAHSALAQETLQEFKFQDYINRDWKSEFVSFPVAANINGRTDLTLLGPDNKPLPYQWRQREDGKDTITFQADVPKNSSSAYRLQKGTPATDTDLKIQEDAQTLRITNARTGITIRKALTGNQGPIAGVLMGSGQWVGDSTITFKKPVESYSVKLLARGPVQAEAVCEISLGAGALWRLRFRLQAGEPAVLVTESHNLKQENLWTLDLSANLAPNKIFGRYGRIASINGVQHGSGDLTTWNAFDTGDQEPVWFLEPWLHWSARDRQGNWFGIYKDSDADMLVLGALRPSVWLDPKKQNWDNANVKVVARGDKIVGDFPLTEGTRAWMIGTFPKAESMKQLGVKLDGYPDAPLPQQTLIKHTDFPLDMVKDYQLTWQALEPKRPCLLVNAEDVARLKASFKPDDALRDRLVNTPINFYNVEPPIRYFLATGDEKLGRKLAEAALQWTQIAVDMLVLQQRQMTLGYSPHHMTSILAAVNLVDAAWNGMTPEERTRVQAQMAFLGYTVMRDDFSSSERGYNGLPNMITAVASYRTCIGSLIATHPMAKTWVNTGLTEAKNELIYWSDENGGCLEAPHYAMASYDFMTGQFLMAHNAGFDNTIFDPKMKKIAEWFAQIQTPPDPRAGNERHQPPIGNTWWNEPTGAFGINARIWKTKDPEFAKEMQWMHLQQGSPEIAGTGGFGPALSGYRSILVDNTIPPKKPNYTSAFFPKTGIMLRNGVSDRETQLHMIQGDHRSHYDIDSGSITFWGKGRPISTDWGYTGGGSRAEHSMLDTQGAGTMYVKNHATSQHFDYVSGTSGIWHRRIMFVKAGDPLGPTYFVIRDTMDAPAPATWRFWCMANDITVNGDSALVNGPDDVDTDIFPSSPESLNLTTQTRIGEPQGQVDKKQFGPLKIPQTALVATTKKGRQYGFLIYPRLKTQKAPEVTRLAGGKVFKITHEAGTDYIFLGDEPFKFNEDGIEFEGISGLVKTRGNKSYLELGGGGRLSAGGNTITKKAIPGVDGKENNNIIKYGDFEGDNIPKFNSSRYNASVFEGNPVPGDTQHQGKRVLKIEYNPDGAGSGAVTLPLPIYVDHRTSYRMSFDAYATGEDMGVSNGGYCYTADKPGVNIVLPSTNVAGYGLDAPVPKGGGWKHFEKVIGASDSDLKDKWYPGTASAGYGFWIGGKGTLYLDNLKVEPVKDEEE